MYETRIPLWLLVGAGVGVGTGDGSDGGSDGAQSSDDDSELDLDNSDGSDDEDDDDPDGADQLGDAGKKALDEMKAKWKSEKQKRIAAEAALAENSTDDEDSKARQRADSDAIAKANSRIVKAEVRAAAAGRLADPADALNFIDLGEFEVGEDGDVDQDEIAEAIDDLVRRKPYLAAQGGTKGPKPDRSQGAKGKGVGSAAQQFAAAIDKLL